MMQYLNIGGYHPDPNVSESYDIVWPIGSIFANEGRRLYELVRKEKPNLVVEIGAHRGCSTTWIATALKENGKGKLISIDNASMTGKTWDLVPKKLHKYIEFVSDDCFACDVPENIDILFEDGMHTIGFTENVLKRFNAKIKVVHDYNHWDCGTTVKREFDRVLGEPDEIFIEPPSDCGLAIKYET